MRYLVEEDLMERYNWTPEQIEKLNYKWLQRHYLIDKAKREAIETKSSIQNYKANAGTSSGRGTGGKTMVRGLQNIVSSNKSSKNTK